MAKMVLDNAYLSIAANDISANVKSVTLNYAAGIQDITAMGDLTKINLGGLKEWSIEAELNQDFAAAGLDSILFPLVGSTVAVILRPDAGAVSTSNPNYSGNAVLASYPPLGGSVGDVAGTSISLQSASTLSRATA